MAILVTGGAGYIGSVTVAYLRSCDEDVVVLDNLSRGHRQAVDSAVPFYLGDVGDRALVSRIAREHKLDSCIHFAGFAYVEESVADPRAYFENNVGQGISLTGTLLQAGVRRLVFSSSCAVYGEPEVVPVGEESRLWPTTPYGWSKLTLERLLASYDAAYGLRFVALRYFNAAGATEQLGEYHQPETHLIARVLETASGKQNCLSVFGSNYATPDGTAVRDYVHVSDLAEAHARALEYLRGGGSSEFLNLGAGRGYSVLEVVECARQVTGKTIPVQMEPRRAGDASRLVADAAKAHRVLKWAPRQSDLLSTLRSAWSWRLQRPSGYTGE